jgi:hypothetical protein
MKKRDKLISVEITYVLLFFFLEKVIILYFRNSAFFVYITL